MLVIVIHLVFALLALLVGYFVFFVPVYNYAKRPNRTPRDGLIVFFSALFTGALLFFLYEFHRDVIRLVGG